MAPERFDGQNWVVIGGAEGVGQAVTLLAAQRGATVVCSGRPGGETAAAELLAAASAAGVSDRLCFVAADPTSPEEVERLFDQALEHFFDLHVLVVADTGRSALPRAGPLAETSLAEWDQNLAVYLRGPFLAVQRALQEFLAGGEGGRIVLIIPSSGQGESLSAREIVAAAALRSFVRSVAKEYGRRGIACNAVIVARLGDRPQQEEDRSQQGAVVAETVLFLASSEASFVNGEVLRVEGNR